jgi:hypothetical protein
MMNFFNKKVVSLIWLAPTNYKAAGPLYFIFGIFFVVIGNYLFLIHTHLAYALNEYNQILLAGASTTMLFTPARNEGEKLP